MQSPLETPAVSLYPGRVIIYQAIEGESLQAIVENTALVSLQPTDEDPYAAEKAVKFPDGTVVFLTDLRTFWFLDGWQARNPAATAE